MPPKRSPLRRAELAAGIARQASIDRDQAIRLAHSEGVTMRVIAAAVGLSPGRVHQIVRAEQP